MRMQYTLKCFYIFDKNVLIFLRAILLLLSVSSISMFQHLSHYVLKLDKIIKRNYVFIHEIQTVSTPECVACSESRKLSLSLNHFQLQTFSRRALTTFERRFSGESGLNPYLPLTVTTIYHNKVKYETKP